MLKQHVHFSSARPAPPRGLADGFHYVRQGQFAADLADGAAAIQLADAVVQRHGRLDALIHVAGGFDSGSPVHQTSDATCTLAKLPKRTRASLAE